MVSSFNLRPGTRIVADIDGTTSPHVTDPGKAFIVPEFLEAAREYNRLYPGAFHFVTGRDTQDAERMINPAGSPARIPYLSNHGVNLVDEFGKTRQLPYTEPERAFIRDMMTRTVAFLSARYPDTAYDIKTNAGLGLADFSGLNRDIAACKGPLVELKSDGIVVYTKYMTGDAAAQAYKDIESFLATICDDALNPGLRSELAGLQDDSAQEKSFALKIETADQMEIRGPYSKGGALFAHGVFAPADRGHVACLVDTLGPTGTDRTMAKAVRQLGGQVVLVLNDRPQNHPQPGDAVYPDQSFASPEDLAQAFAGWVQGLKTAPRPAPAAAPAPPTA